MRRKMLLLPAACLLTFAAVAQPSLRQLKNTLSQTAKQAAVADVELSTTLDFIGSVRFKAGKAPAKDGTVSWLKTNLQLRNGQDLLKQVKVEANINGVEIQTIQQFYKGYPVEHGVIKASSKDGIVTTMQMEFYSIPDHIATTPLITEAAALENAKAFAVAEKYVWEDYTGSDPERMKPAGQLVYVQDIFKKIGQMCFAYKFLVEAEKPMNKVLVYVNAITGEVVFSDQLIKHINAPGTADTRYSGTQAIFADRVSETAYRLRELRNGDSIVTLNYQKRVYGTGNTALATDFTDNDNNWTSAEFNNANYDNAALDVHWGLEKVSDYWNLVHGRAGWNNAHGIMRSYVHVRNSSTANYDNAFWSGSDMFYGDGTYLSGSTNGFLPLTSLDVTAHELGHAVCQTTANLVYQRESGGLNEGFSDIWGAAVEHYSGLGGAKQNFKVGEEITPTAGFLRDMQNPNAGNQPDTYLGTLWYPTSLGGCPTPSSNTNDNCGVHYNSGVINKWFYLVVQGESGTNDFGNAYNITRIGWAKAEQITYLAEQNLTPNSDYAATRIACINAATTLFGACSNEVIQVTNAWYAVGVGGTANCTPVVEFVNAKTATSERDATASGCTTKTISIPVKLASVASAPVTINITAAGTAVNNVHYTLPASSLVFTTGQSGTKNFLINILDNAAIDGSKTIILNYSVNAAGGDAAAGTNNQLHTVTISDDDVAPLAINSTGANITVLLNENFESQPETIPTGWSNSVTGYTTGSNAWAVGANGGINGQSAYITSNATTKPLSYTATSTTDKLLRTKVLNTTGLSDIKLSFNYKVEGEYELAPPIAAFDFGRIMYSLNGTSYSFISDSSGAPYIFFGKGTSVTSFGPVTLPAAVANKATVYFAFRWTNDNNTGGNPPLAIDDIIVTGRSTAAVAETTAGQGSQANLISGSYSSYLYSNADSQLIARVQDVNQNVGCLNATVLADGNGQRTITTSSGAFAATQKVIQLTPATPNSSAAYTGTLYFTATELAVWGANKTNLKILKVTDGTSLSSILNSSNIEVITPTSVVDNSGTTGIISYTANFTGFSQFLLADAAITLPVKLTGFTVSVSRNDALLNWKTEQEITNKGFNILRSYDGINFSKIGFVAANMNAAGAQQYGFTDVSIIPNINIHYRLQQVDVDGKTTLSDIRTIKLVKSLSSLTFVQPNPASSYVTINFSGPVNAGRISLVDVQGRELIIRTISSSLTQTTLPLNKIAAGIYFVRITNGTVTETHKLLVE